MLETHFRQAATVLLESAIRLAPADVRNWGQAMRGELNYVEGTWAGTMWALGGAGVMAKHAVLSLIVPGRRGSDLVPDGGLFAKNVFFRRAALAAGCACVLAALLFFAAPPFRQAFGVATKPWLLTHQVATKSFHPDIEGLAARVERQHDPEGLTFCALRLQTGDQSQTGDLYAFLNATEMPPGGSPHLSQTLLEALVYSGSPSFLFYVWTGVTLLGVIGLALILLRHFLGRPRANSP